MNGDTRGPTDFGHHYDERSPVGERYGGGQLHMWYWYDDEDPASLPEAVERVSDRVAQALGARSGERVLDAGCGTGGLALRLARATGARVTGVTISRYEVRRARERARLEPGGSKTDFLLGDFAELPFENGSFDAVVALESLQNASDLDRVLAEFHRVLRPGGRLTFADLSRESDTEPTRLAHFMSSLELRRLPSMGEWLEALLRAGFAVEEHTQCGPRVYGRKNRYLRASIARRGELADEFSEDDLARYADKHRGFFAARRDQVGYVIVSARRP
ncbi:class I SAM-dependent methyltransferase [Nocardiopsis quinghaiensis]|uniref:class I SAM-dependent methyltransferase n=1 Tax=Nocardiopsis quinghaiensis TaxID=464995 RepID=UPI00123A6069|nr:methyltransferase domain-containing protein [Nocardiopsis quinghaiensis]